MALVRGKWAVGRGSANRLAARGFRGVEQAKLIRGAAPEGDEQEHHNDDGSEITQHA